MVGTDSLKDMYAMCLRNIFLVPQSSSTVYRSMVLGLLPKLTSVFRNVSSDRLLMISVDLLGVLLSTTSSARMIVNSLGEYPSTFEKSLLAIISLPAYDLSVRQRCAGLLGLIAGGRSDEDLKKALRSIADVEIDFALIGWIHAIVKAGLCGRLKPYLSEFILPPLLAFISEELAKGDCCDTDLVNMVLTPSMDQMIGLRSCRSDSGYFLIAEQLISPIRDLAIQGLRFDPNYYDSTHAADYEEYEDTDDSSWKVRRASASVLGTFLSRGHTKSEIIAVLVGRLKTENESVVRCQILSSLEGIILACDTKDILKSIPRVTKDMRAQKILERVINFPTQPLPHVSSVEIVIEQSQLEPLSAPVEVPADVGPKILAVQTISELVAKTDFLSTNFLPPLLEKLFIHIPVVPGIISDVDLGPFKHRVDAAAGLRRSVISLVDLIGRKLAQRCGGLDHNEKSRFSHEFIAAIMSALMVDLSNSGEELYLHVISLMESVQAMDCGALLDTLPGLCGLVGTIIERAPVGKKGGDETAPNTIGTTLGKLVSKLISGVTISAQEEGYRFETIIARHEFASLRNALLRIRKEQTQGSILMGAKLYLDTLEIGSV